MAKRRKKREVNQNEVFAMLELRLCIIQHAQALRGVTALLAEGRTEAAIARLDGAVTALLATTRGQCAGMTMKCPHCGSDENVVAWVDDGLCSQCGGELKAPGND